MTEAAKLPWIKFYPSDWCSEKSLRVCSLAARGLWFEMLAAMHEATPRGSLLMNGKQMTLRHLAALVGATVHEVEGLLSELREFGVFSEDEDGTIYSRRMRRDEKKAKEDKDNGSKGGNPALKSGDNPQRKPGDKAQKPEARGQNLDNNTPPSQETPRDEEGGGEGDASQFCEKLVAAYPKGRHSPLKVQAAVAEIPSPDWPTILAGAKAYAEEYRRKPTTHPVALDRFVRERMFVDQTAKATGPPSVFVAIGTPAWAAHVAAGHEDSRRVDSKQGIGWYFATEWPPNGQESAA